MAKFKTRARTVDMLGRQQIAGVPNAISELFKNAHDAYADNAVVDYFRSDRLFVLRDDGLGMTLEDFENRWLTIGTESKVPSLKGIGQPPVDPDKPRRSITGEKGIGRLAVAAVGSQVLILTRAKRGAQLHDLVAAFIHWGLFTLPGVNLEDIEIPLRTFPNGTLPSNDDVLEMVKQVQQNVLKLQEEGFIDPKTGEGIIQELSEFRLDLEGSTDFLGEPSLLKDGYGTHFYILPARDEITQDLETFYTQGVESRIRKLLLGFTNTMVPKSENGSVAPALRNEFRYWRTDETSIDLIGSSEFFTPNEFESADHRLQGEFDEYGQFVGTVDVFGERTTNHVVGWQKGGGQRVACGPFRIDVAYIQGLVNETTLPPEEYSRLSRKLDAIGGLYIYKDGIRVLPYGDIEVDFLRFEERRSKKASYYFFSYRRMFGAIELTQIFNSALAEKAGREGFQDNKAYRQFKDILENFFIQVAADFFRKGGRYSATFTANRDARQRLQNAAKQKEQESQDKRKRFEADLETVFEKVNNGTFHDEVSAVVRKLKQDIDAAAQQQDEIALLTAELNAKRSFTAVRNRYKVERPEGVGLTRQLLRDWDAYALEVARLDEEVLSKAEAEIESIVTNASETLKFALDRKQRIELLLNETLIDSRNAIQSEIQFTNDTFTNLLKRFSDLTREMTDASSQTARAVEAEIRATDIVNQSPAEVEAYRRKWQERVDEEARKYVEVLKHIRAQVETINWYRDDSGYLIGNAEITAALEDEVLALRERVDADVELAQLGMALNIINHEFSNTVRAIRNGLRRLRAWANDNPRLVSVYQEIADNFTHLDGYLTLFTPLNRRLYRSKVEITGNNIAKYAQDLFSERLRHNKVELIVSESFRKVTIIGYPSSFYPVFVNLIDNSIFWLSDHPLPREVKLDARGDTLILSDNGPGIPPRDRDAIFEQGFTRKPGGRGMGLYISREVLKKEGYKLELIPDYAEKGSTFIISPIDKESAAN